MKVMKRDGTEVEFDSFRIENALRKANADSAKPELSNEQIFRITENVTAQCRALNHTISVEDIQDMVELEIMREGAYLVAQHYTHYRERHAANRDGNTTDGKLMALVKHKNEEANQENSNKNPIINSVMRDYMAGEASRDLTDRLLLPANIVDAHKKGIIHFHDGDYFAQPMYNCCLVNLKDMLMNGTVISGTMIESPHTFSTACNVATQIIAQVASNQYGGQSISLSHLVPFVERSRQKIRAEVEEELADLHLSKERISKITEKRLRKEINRGVQIIQYQVITLMTTNGQAPFLSVFMYLGEVETEAEKHDLAMIIEEVLRQRTQGVKNEVGVWITPAFPKLLYVLEEDNVHPDSPYYYLTELAAKCTAKRLVPDYMSEKIMKQLKEGNCFPVMGCRSNLAPWRDENGNYQFYGRFNQGVVTINLPDVALSAGFDGTAGKGDLNRFWEIFDERLQLCYEGLMCRHDRLLGNTSDIAPILWQHGAIARLQKGEKIDQLLFGGYSSISLGYAGLAECVFALTGKSHTDASAKPLAMQIMQHMNEACDRWKAETNIAFSIYGTPIESTTYKFAKSLQKRFGMVAGVSDKAYITNSYHVKVTEEIDAFTKLSLESEFQALSKGGAISYVEVPNLQHNIPAVLAVIQYIYDNIMYAELNTKSDYCHVCGFDGEIQIVEEEGKLIWECPNCKNRDQQKMNVARRTCGYIGSAFWGQGRTWEIKERVLHLS